MLITMLAATSSFSFQLVVVIFFLSLIIYQKPKQQVYIVIYLCQTNSGMCGSYLDPSMSVFNKSLSSVLFPDDWKYAVMTPLFKQGG